MTDEKLKKANTLRSTIDMFQERIEHLEAAMENKTAIFRLVFDSCSVQIKTEDAIALLTQELLNLRAAQEKLMKQFKRL